MGNTRILINGYGRIGRVLHRILLSKNDKNLTIAAINSRSNASSHAHLLKYDSTYGILNNKVRAGSDYITVDNNKIKVFTDKDPGEIDFKKEGIDLVVECTGKYRDRESCLKHIQVGAKKVVISAPGEGEDISIVLGVNHENYRPKKHHIVSNASCTTNCLALVIKVLEDNFGIACGQMTTIHALTLNQNLLDKSHSKDLRIARAAIDSFMPYKTGATKAIGAIFPKLNGKLDALSVRIPFNTVSLVDLVVWLKKKTTVDSINQAFVDASRKKMKNVLGITFDPLVSIDFKGECRTGIIDGLSTKVVGGRLAKILAWYDNEWGYSCRLYDLIKMVSNTLN